jgi:hypothetical protein
MPRDVMKGHKVTTSSPAMQMLLRGCERLKKGWVKGHVTKYEMMGTVIRRSYCMSGALLEINPNSSMAECIVVPQYVGAYAQADTMLETAVNGLSNNGCEIHEYNDSPVRIKADVLEVYDVAIELLSRKEQGLPI